MTDLVNMQIVDSVAIITLNRPEAMNALSRPLRAKLGATLRMCDADQKVRAIVLTGAGDRAFSAGLDRADLPEEMADVEHDVPTSASVDPALAVAGVRLPVIAAVNGVAMTGGLELLLACDFAVASENARFADTHGRLGLLSMWGLSQRLPGRIGNARAKQMSLTGEFIDANRALAWGLVNEVVPASDLLDRALTLARSIAVSDRQTIVAAKRLIEEGRHMPLPEGLSFEQREARSFLRATWQQGPR